MAIVFCKQPCFDFEIKGGIATKVIRTLTVMCVERGLTVNVEKIKVMVFNSINPCQEFVFKGDFIERVQSFKYLGILFETTSNLDNVVEHLAVINRHSLFIMNRRYAKLHIMDIKLCCDLFNM
jgi:hypothetical protein